MLTSLGGLLRDACVCGPLSFCLLNPPEAAGALGPVQPWESLAVGAFPSRPVGKL